MTAPEAATQADRRQWARYLVEERAEGAVYANLARRRTGEEQQILLSLAEAERRHEQHWRVPPRVAAPAPPPLPVHRLLLGRLARVLRSVLLLALAPRDSVGPPYTQ